MCFLVLTLIVLDWLSHFLIQSQQRLSEPTPKDGLSPGPSRQPTPVSLQQQQQQQYMNSLQQSSAPSPHQSAPTPTGAYPSMGHSPYPHSSVSPHPKAAFLPPTTQLNGLPESYAPSSANVNPQQWSQSTGSIDPSLTSQSTQESNPAGTAPTDLSMHGFDSLMGMDELPEFDFDQYITGLGDQDDSVGLGSTLGGLETQTG